MAIERSIDEKVCRALVALLNADPDLGAFYNGRCRYLPPTVDPELIELPDIFVQNVHERDALNRMMGNAVAPTVNARIGLLELERVTPYSDDEPPSANVVNRIVAVERAIERGQDVEDGVGLGKLVDPDALPTDPPATRILNTVAPRVIRQSRIRIDISPEQDRSVIAVLFPLLVTYETRQDRLTRRSR